MTATVALQPLEEEIVDVLGERGYLTAREIRVALAARERVTTTLGVRVRLAGLARMGLVVRHRQGLYGQPTIWRLP